MFDGIKRAMILGGVRWAAGVFGGGIALFAFSHTQVMAWVQQACTLMSSQQAMEVGLPAFAVAVASLVLSLQDKVNVGAKMAVTASSAYDQGVAAQSTSDTTKVAAVAQAMKAADTAAPATKAAIVTALKTGTF